MLHRLAVALCVSICTFATALPVRAAPKHDRRAVQASHPPRQARRPARPTVPRCRDVFCTAQRVNVDGPDGEDLRHEHVSREVRRLKPQLVPCAIEERRREPGLRRAEIEFVISPAGRVLATRVNGQRRSRLARCIQQQLSRLARFPRVSQRQVASFALTVLN